MCRADWYALTLAISAELASGKQRDSRLVPTRSIGGQRYYCCEQLRRLLLHAIWRANGANAEQSERPPSPGLGVAVLVKLAKDQRVEDCLISPTW